MSSGVGQRSGDASRALCERLRHLSLWSVPSLEASCLEGHTGSRRILEGLGLKLEDVRPGYRLKEDVRHTELNFGAEISTMDLSEIEGMEKAAGIV